MRLVDGKTLAALLLFAGLLGCVTQSPSVRSGGGVRSHTLVLGTAAPATTDEPPRFISTTAGCARIEPSYGVIRVEVGPATQPRSSSTFLRGAALGAGIGLVGSLSCGAAFPTCSAVVVSAFVVSLGLEAAFTREVESPPPVISKDEVDLKRALESAVAVHPRSIATRALEDEGSRGCSPPAAGGVGEGETPAVLKLGLERAVFFVDEGEAVRATLEVEVAVTLGAEGAKGRRKSAFVRTTGARSVSEWLENDRAALNAALDVQVAQAAREAFREFSGFR
jgi:hypothetical protein